MLSSFDFDRLLPCDAFLHGRAGGVIMEASTYQELYETLMTTHIVAQVTSHHMRKTAII